MQLVFVLYSSLQKMLRCLLTRINNAVTLRLVPSRCIQVWTIMVLSTPVKHVTRPWRGTSGARWPSTCYVSVVKNNFMSVSLGKNEAEIITSEL